MAISDNKITNFTNVNVGQSARPSLTVLEVQQLLDSSPEELRVALNGLIDGLLSTTDGNSGADNIYLTAIAGLAGNTVQKAIENLSEQQLDIITLKATGDAETDTANIQAAFNNFRNVIFENSKTTKFVINEPITVNPITEDFGLRGRIINFNNCLIECVQKEGVSPSNAFIFTSSAYPSNLRDTTIKNVIFGGTVTGSFLKLQGSTVYNVKVENIFTMFDAYANALVEFNATDAGANSGINIVKNLYPYTHVKYTLLFSAEVGADGQFDDYVVQGISNIYADGTDGATIKLDDNTQLIYSNLKVLYFGGKGHCIRGGLNTFIQDCNIDNIYMEPKSATSIALFTSFLRCKVDIIHMKFDTAVTTFARATYGLAVNCVFTNFYQTNNSGVQVSGLYCEEVGACLNNTYKNIGYGTPTTYIKLVGTTSTSTIEGYYGDPFIYNQVGSLQTYNDGVAHANVQLMAIPETEITDNAMLRFKVRGSTTASANNRFTIKLFGTGVNITLLNFTVDTAEQWEVDLDIIKMSATTLAYYCKSFIGNVMGNVYGGTPALSSITIPNDLKLVIDVSNCAYINVSAINCMRSKSITKPT